jgi:hypothetical protein
MAEETKSQEHSFTKESIGDDVVTLEESLGVSQEITDAEKKLVRKLDFLYVMPCIAILNFLQVKKKNDTK